MNRIAGPDDLLTAKQRIPWSRQQFVRNVISNVVLVFLNFGLNLWLVPYLIRHLGVAAYGVVPLATTLTAYLGLITLSLNSALGRFLTIDLERCLFSSANRTFNTAFFASLMLCSVVGVVSFWVVAAAPRLFNLPQGQETSAQWLFALAALAFMFSTIESNFSISSWARNRFDLRNGVAMLSRIAQVGIILLAFMFFNAQLWHVGLGMLGASIVSLIASIALWRHLTPQLRIQISAFDRSKVRQLSGMSGWMLINQIGSLLFLNIDLIIVNLYFGAEKAGRYGAVLQLSAYLRTLANMLVGVLTPTILAKYAENDWAGMNRISAQSVKLIGIVIAIPIGLLCGLSKSFLTIWLGSSFQASALLLVALTVHLSINLAVLSLFPIQLALNKVRWPGLVTFGMGVANIGLAIGLARWGGWGVIGVAVAGAITLTLKNAIFTPIYSAAIQRLPWWTFLSVMMHGLVGTIALAIVAHSLSILWAIDSWTKLVTAGSILSILYCGIVYFFGLNRNDRASLRSFIPGLAKT